MNTNPLPNASNPSSLPRSVEVNRIIPDRQAEDDENINHPTHVKLTFNKNEDRIKQSKSLFSHIPDEPGNPLVPENDTRIFIGSKQKEYLQTSSSDQNCLFSRISQVWQYCVKILNIIWENLKRIFIWKGSKPDYPLNCEILESGPYYHVIWVHIYNFFCYIGKFVKSYRHIFCLIPLLITFGLSIFITYISMRNSEEFVREVIISFLMLFYFIKAIEWLIHLITVCILSYELSKPRQKEKNDETMKDTLDIWKFCFIWFDCIYYILLAITLLSNQIFFYFKDRFPATPVV